MSDHFAGWDERTLGLAVERCTVGLDPTDLARLEARAQPEDLEAFEHAVSALHLAALPSLEAPPPGLVERLQTRARAELGATPGPAPRPLEAAPAPRLPLAAAAGWLAAAVLALLLFARGVEPGEAPPERRRDDLVASGAAVQRLDWTGTEDPLAAGVTGDVVWSSERQEGYMTFRGLAPNDPTEEQYQLWIFDPSRADWEAKPVDGGVFDVGPAGEVVVPIDPKLEVRSAALFAVTLEEPGGVVVSTRERLILTASG